MIDKKRLFKSLIIISLIIIIIIAFIQIRKTLARYETSATAERDVEVAFWVVDNDFKTDRILIEDIYPRDNNPFEYVFTVSNFNIDNTAQKAETDLEYEIVLTSTTNLPLSYEITKDGDTCTKVEELYTDADGTCYREIKLETVANSLVIDSASNTTHEFVIKVTFPKSYSANPDYSDLIEDIKIELSAKQVIG